jgi:mRNA interferase MazF
VVIRRGEVWWAGLGSPRGSAPALQRPVVVVSADFVNRSALATVSVIGLTSNVKWAGAPGNVLLSGGTAGLNQDSVVNVTQLQTVDRSGLDARIGRVPRLLMRDIDAGLRRVLDLQTTGSR